LAFVDDDRADRWVAVDVLLSLLERREGPLRVTASDGAQYVLAVQILITDLRPVFHQLHHGAGGEPLRRRVQRVSGPSSGVQAVREVSSPRLARWLFDH
jgi:hypothetical protein